MKGTIIGFEPVDYVKKGTDERVKGVHLIIKCRSNDVIGFTAKEEFVKAESPWYKLLAPYLANDMDGLLEASVYIDYQVTQRGSYTFTDIVDMEITPAPKPEEPKPDKKGA